MVLSVGDPWISGLSSSPTNGYESPPMLTTTSVARSTNKPLTRSPSTPAAASLLPAHRTRRHALRPRADGRRSEAHGRWRTEGGGVPPNFVTRLPPRARLAPPTVLLARTLARLAVSQPARTADPRAAHADARDVVAAGQPNWMRPYGTTRGSSQSGPGWRPRSGAMKT